MDILNTLIIGAQVGLIYGPLALGIYFALNVMSLPDLTLEGSFGVGGATTAILLVNGLDPATALAGGVASGMAMGFLTACLHVYLHMNVLLAGILMTTAAWSISLAIMGAGNISLLSQATLFDWVGSFGLTSQWSQIVVGAVFSLVIAGALIWLLHTNYGMSLRAAGLNIQTARSLGIRTEMCQIAGLIIANGLAAMTGGLVVQSQGFMDVSIQTGVIVIGLAALMIGMSIFKTPRIVPSIVGVILGIFIYRVVVTLALKLGLPPYFIKLATAIVVFIIVAMRSHGFGFIALPGSERARKAAREHLDYLENDRVVNIT
ncbi:putative ABC transport system permease protein [Pseudaminobacter salicylatoxidans]|uniref:Putative ABC transport system permease protein n=1 Tax=Pseudaminobacter salicylatoxidans TaxID=93369 RepID=A0A316C4A7_PSESE|nr:ABC transporter permease [Pseudaminobacter salicylatoxidans]PWJ84575.1 putative ABC transport system permease protein [Pseudaminobacter salicylatoxidans]